MSEKEETPEIHEDVKEKEIAEEAKSGYKNEDCMKFQKIIRAMKHLVSFQEVVNSCNLTFLFRAGEMAVVTKAIEKREEEQEVNVSVENGRIGIKVVRGMIHKFAVEDGERALVYVNNPVFCDCVLKLGNTNLSFYCHKPYLKRRSQYFEAMLSNFMESGQEDIEIEVLYPAVFETVLEFIYGGECRESLQKEWSTDNSLYFWMMWTAVYLQVDELITLLISSFKSEFKKSPLFNAQHFPLSILERWIETYHKIPVGKSDQVRKLTQQPYSESQILKLCFTWSTNSQDLPEFANNISHLIKRYNLLNASTVYLVKHFFSVGSSSLQENLDPLGLISFIGEHCNSYYYPRLGMN